MDKQKHELVPHLTIANLLRCIKTCSKGLRWKLQVQHVCFRPLTTAAQLKKLVETRTYKPKYSKRHTIHERGKIRIIRPPSVWDRILHTWICRYHLLDAIKLRIIDNNGACLKNRGLDYTLDKLAEILEKAPIDGWFLQFDFRKYFPNINQHKLLNKLDDIVDNHDVKWLLHRMIESDSKGLELGSFVSQICAVYYPNDIDHALSNLDGVVGYVRYMDDGIVVCKDKATAIHALHILAHHTDALDIKLNPKKTFINKITHRIVFCKHRFIKMKNGLLRREVRKEQTRHIRKHLTTLKRKGVDIEPIKACYHGYLSRGTDDLTWLLGNDFI